MNPHVAMTPGRHAETNISISLSDVGDRYALLRNRIHENELGCIKQLLKFLGPLPIDPSACWLWEGGTDACGYGAVVWKQQKYAAHRLSYELFVGQIQPGLCVCHACDNPPCVNPLHLWVGTHADNMLDRSLKGRVRVNSKPETETNIGNALKRSVTTSTPDLLIVFPASHGGAR